MYKRIKKILLGIFLFNLCFICCNAEEYIDNEVLDTYNQTDLEPNEYSNHGFYEYEINKYNIDIIVNDNNTFDITENITAYFNIPKHGIFRTIPIKNEVLRLDGSTYKNRAKVTDINVDNEFTTAREEGNLKIQIGSENHTLTGEQQYTIKYKYTLGNDKTKDFDELYYNIIGNEWDTSISNITFKITMPKSFDSSKLGFSSGPKGSTENANVEYNVEGNIISGRFNEILNPNEGLTVRCELPEGYFILQESSLDIISIIAIILPILFSIISYLLWKKYGKDDKVIETVEFYPPKDTNSLEVGFLYNGKAENKDVISLLIYLANKGYIKISEIESKGLFKKSKDFKITKIKDYDGNNENEKVFLEGLFKEKNTIDLFKKNNEEEIKTKNEVTSEDLQNNFYITLNKIILNTNNKENRRKIFEKSSLNKKIYVFLMIAITLCLITIPPLYIYAEEDAIPFALLFPGIGFTVLFSSIFGNNTKSSKIFGFIWGIGFGGIPMAFMVIPTLLFDKLYLIIYIIGFICFALMGICLGNMEKRTPYGNEMLGKISGFKTFLETAEKDKLEAMVNENPTYFYDILPYTYVLGVSDKWIKKFETISMKSPSWYDSPNDFNMIAFSSFMDSTMTSATTAMSSSPSSSSGGGSSGGGSGGGGGGSW